MKKFIVLVCIIISDQQNNGGNQTSKLSNKTMSIQYAYTILYVPDVEKTMKFYESTFNFRQKLLTPEHDYGELASGQTTLSFASLALANSNFDEEYLVSNHKKPPFGIELAFTTNNVSALMEKALENGAHLVSEIETKPWGQHVGYVKDPNGFLIEICTPMNQ
ncbi:MAG: VOC family protein [Bacteroidota bacterium]